MSPKIISFGSFWGLSQITGTEGELKTPERGFGMLLKGMGDNFLLSKDEYLAHDIDGVTAL